MGVHEVLIPNSVKDLLTHCCLYGQKREGEVLAVPWGQNCPNARHGCGFSNPPKNKFGATHHSVVMTDGQINEFNAKWGEGKLKFADETKRGAK